MTSRADGLEFLGDLQGLPLIIVLALYLWIRTIHQSPLNSSACEDLGVNVVWSSGKDMREIGQTARHHRTHNDPPVVQQAFQVCFMWSDVDDPILFGPGPC